MTNGLTEEVVKELLGILRSTKDFVLEQAPDVVQQLVTYQIVSRVLGCVASVVALGAAVWLGRRAIAELKKPLGEEIIAVGGGAVSAFLGVFSTCALLSSVYSLCWWILAPKLALLEYFARLIK